MRVSIWPAQGFWFYALFCYMVTPLFMLCWMFLCGRQMGYFWGYFLSLDSTKLSSTSFSNHGAAVFSSFPKQIPHGSPHQVELEQEAGCSICALKIRLSPALPGQVPKCPLKSPLKLSPRAALPHVAGWAEVWLLFVPVPGAASNTLNLSLLLDLKEWPCVLWPGFLCVKFCSLFLFCLFCQAPHHSACWVPSSCTEKASIRFPVVLFQSLWRFML